MAAVILFGGLVVALAGCSGGSKSGAPATVTVTTTEATSTDATQTDVYGNTTDTTTTGTDCEELTSLVEGPAPTLDMTWEEAVLTKSSDIQAASAALSKLASEAPQEIRSDFETVSAAWAKIARLIADLGVLTGKHPDAAKVQATNQLVRGTLATPEFSDASSSVSAWFESAVAQCQSTTTTTETSTNSGPVPVTAETCATLRQVFDHAQAISIDGSWDYVNDAKAMDDFADHVQVPDQVAGSVSTFRKEIDLLAAAYQEAGVAPNKTPLPDQLDKINKVVPASGDTRANQTVSTWIDNDCS